ncbi:hypothetical protein [Candidatus Rariloculus sp.]|uniref:hypothetical protein n=1 Tax=Candidatus Rariloculus sp. TaxID=3101265 RepID=UPI003D140D40
MTRLVIASIGGALITFTILLGMSEVAQKFRERDPTRYYRIVDFIPAPDGWRRPEFRDPALPPERTQLPYEGSGPTIAVEPPSADIAVKFDASPVVIEELSEE